MADVGEATGVTHLISPQPEMPDDNIHSHICLRMPQVGMIIDSRAAHIHANPLTINGTESLKLSREEVVNPECHVRSLTGG